MRVCACMRACVCVYACVCVRARATLSVAVAAALPVPVPVFRRVCTRTHSQRSTRELVLTSDMYMYMCATCVCDFVCVYMCVCEHTCQTLCACVCSGGGGVPCVRVFICV